MRERNSKRASGESRGALFADPIGLTPCTGRDFAWLLGERDGDLDLSVAPELAPTEVLAVVRGLPRSWMIIEGGEIVGLISLLGGREQPPETVEIGYGVAASREGRGFASRAVRSLLDIFQSEGVKTIVAESSVTNPASERVLVRNGFSPAGERDDAEDGRVIQWRLELD